MDPTNPRKEVEDQGSKWRRGMRALKEEEEGAGALNKHLDLDALRHMAITCQVGCIVYWMYV
jgi:hypothetical protein